LRRKISSILNISQYEMRKSQSLTYAATNIHITFKCSSFKAGLHGGGNEIDRTAINRLYAITFPGKHCASNILHHSMFQMLTSGKYYINILPNPNVFSMPPHHWLG
jgi:hypothetical protein